MTKSRIISIYVFVVITFIILFARYFYLQLIDYQLWLKQSINNYSSTILTKSNRGAILDRNNVILATNKISYVAAVLKKDIPQNANDVFESLAKYINYTDLDIKKFNLQRKSSKKYDWIILKDDLSDKEIAMLTSHLFEFPYLQISARTKRYYPFKDIYSHSIGYIGRLSQIDQNKLQEKALSDFYLNKDYIGKSGLEQYYESTLRGQLGRKTIKTDANGNELALINNNKPQDGDSIVLTIDNNLQKIAWEALGNRKGAIVALDPRDGGILAFVSKPGFDPNWFIDGIGIDDWNELFNDPQKPLVNRASQSTFPPGSTFKPFMAIAALVLGIRAPNSTIIDPGYFTIPGSNHRFRDSYPYGRGLIDFTRAIAVSSDTFFYKLGYDMNIDNADYILNMFNFGKQTGIDLPNEKSGVLPSRKWKKDHFKNDKYQQKWHAVDSVTFGIGQGLNNYTPLQMAYATSIIANNGRAITPHFLDKIIDSRGYVVESYLPKITQLPIPESDFVFVKKAMQKVITEGTGVSISQGLKYTLAGKTGTAQVVSMNRNNRKAKFSGANYRDHSWFIAFAPVESPVIAVAVFVENGGMGAAAAAPIARKMIDFYILGSKLAEENQQYEKFTPQYQNDESNIVENDEEKNQ